MVTKRHYHDQWKGLHQKFNARDGYFQLSQNEQVIILRLQSGQNRMRYHLHTKFKIGTTSLCHCGLVDMTVEHFQQDCSQFTDLLMRHGKCLSALENNFTEE
jgi:hypothetical protein